MSSKDTVLALPASAPASARSRSVAAVPDPLESESPYAGVTRPVLCIRLETEANETALPVARSIHVVVWTEHDHGSVWTVGGVLASKRESAMLALDEPTFSSGDAQPKT